MKNPRTPTHIPDDPSHAFASMGIYLFRAKSLARGVDRRCPGEHGARFRQKHHSPHDRLPPGLRVQISRTPIRKPSSTGATSERWTPTGKPTWIWSPSIRCSIYTTSSGRFAPIKANSRRPNSSSRRITRAAAWASPWTPSCAAAASSPAAESRPRSSPPTCVFRTMRMCGSR